MSRNILLFLILLLFQSELMQSRPGIAMIDTTGYWEKVKSAEKLAEAGKYQLALDTLQIIHEAYIEKNDLKKVIKTSFEIARVALRTQNLKLALEKIKSAQISIYKNHLVSPDILGEFSVVKGAYYHIAGQVDSAEYYLNQALSLLPKNPGKKSMIYVNALDEMGRIFDLQARYDDALKKFDEALEIVLELKDGESTTSADLYNNMGSIYGSKGDLEKQLEFYLKSLNVGLSFYDSSHVQVGANYNNIGYNYAARGDHEASIPWFEKSLKIHLAAYGEAHTYTTSNFMNLGYAHGQAGDYGKAFFYLDKALAGRLAVVGENNPEVADVYHNIAFFHGRTRNFKDERANYLKALRIREANFGGAHPLVGINKAMLGQTYTSTGELDSALILMQQGLDIISKSLGENHLYTSVIYYELGNCYASLDNFTRAEAAFLKSRDIRIATGGPNHSDLPKLYLEMGTLYYLNDFPDKARHFLNEGLKIQTIDYPSDDKEYYLPALEKLKKELITVLLLGHKAITYRKGDDKDLRYGQSLFFLADSLARALRDSYEANVSKLALSNFINTTYFGGMDNALKLYEKERESAQFEYAFSFAEKARATLLQEIIHESKALVSAGIPAEIRSRESEIKSARSFHEKIIFEEKQKKELADSSRLLNSLNKQFELAISQQKLIEELEQKYPQYYQLKYDHNIVSISELQEKLMPEEAMILFSSGDRYIATFLISYDTKEYHLFRFDKDWKKEIEAFIRLLNDETRVINEGNAKAYFKEFTHNAHQLYRELLEPVLGGTNDISKLIIVPDGLISYLPFDLLLTQPPNDSSGFATLPYLIKKYQIRYAHSATLFTHPKEEGKKGRLYAGVAPEYKAENENEIKDIFSMRSGLSPDRLSFSHLPNSGPEVAEAGRLLGGKVWLGGEGTEKRFKEEIAGKFQILHLATHAWVNDENPLYSGLLFSVDHTNQNSRDTLSANEGLLYAYELYQMQFEADLAVLSACETGRGKLLKGEGMMNLARAFRYAGCKNILMSLWRANDAATRELINGYFQYLASGKGKAEALRLAKLDMISKSSWKHPSYWAGFVIIGDDEPVKSSSKWWIWVVGFTLIIMLGGILLFRRR